MAGDDEQRLTRSAAPSLARSATTAARDRTIALLSDAFAVGRIDVDELERRVTLAHTVADAAALATLTTDLGDVATAHPASHAAAAPLIPAAEVRQHDHVLAFMGGTQRAGAWAVPQQLRVTTVMGGAVLDFREARLPAGVVDVWITTIMGGVSVVVPPSLAVETHGTAIMGGFEQVDRAPASPDPAAPLLRIHGLAFMGGVEVTMRLPGESERQARKRQRREARRPPPALP